MTTWRIFPIATTNIGVARGNLEKLGVSVTGFDHRRGAFVGCKVSPGFANTFGHAYLPGAAFRAEPEE